MKNTENKNKRLETTLLVLGGAFLLLHLLLRFTGVVVWDDAYIFYRYASHFFSGDNLAWNPGETPGYGATSLVWTLLVSIAGKAGASPAATLYAGSLFLGLLLLSLLWRKIRGLKWLFALLLLANAPSLAEHFSSGMDTAVVLVFMFLFLTLAERFNGSPFMGVMAGIAWMVRPELAALCIGVLLISAVQNRKEGLKIWVAPALALLLTGVCALVCFWWMGSALPLPFFSKTGSHHDEGIRMIYRWEGLQQFVLFALANTPLFWLIFRKKKIAIATLQWWLPAVFICLFYLLGVTQIMGYDQRFYYTTWPLWAMAAIHSAKAAASSPIKWKPWIPLSIVAGFVLTMLQGKPESLAARWGKFDIEEVYLLSGGEYNWPILDKIMSLPPDAGIATSEIGLPGVWNLKRPIFDLGGLTDPKRLQGESLVLEIVSQKRPDVIYFPNPNYTSLNAEFMQSQAFREEYILYPAEQLGSIQGLALRKASPHFDALQKDVAVYIASH